MALVFVAAFFKMANSLAEFEVYLILFLKHITRLVRYQMNASMMVPAASTHTVERDFKQDEASFGQTVTQDI